MTNIVAGIMALPLMPVFCCLAGALFDLPVAILSTLAVRLITTYLTSRLFYRYWGKSLVNHPPEWLSDIQPFLRQQGFTSILTLRLLPIVPFWAVNISAGILAIAMPTLLMATLLGSLPLVCYQSWLGSVMGGIIDGQSLRIIVHDQLNSPVMAISPLLAFFAYFGSKSLHQRQTNPNPTT